MSSTGAKNQIQGDDNGHEDDDADYYDTSESEVEGPRVWQTLEKKKQDWSKLGGKKKHLHIYTHIHIGRYIQVGTMGKRPRV